MSGSSAALLATTIGSSGSDGQARRVHAATTYTADFDNDGMKHHRGLTNDLVKIRGLTIQHVGVGLNA